MMMGCGVKRFRHFKTVQVFIYYCLLVQRLSVITGTTDTRVYKKKWERIRGQSPDGLFMIWNSALGQRCKYVNLSSLKMISANHRSNYCCDFSQFNHSQYFSIDKYICNKRHSDSQSLTKKRIENVQSEWRKGTEIYKNGSFRSQQRLF